MHLAVPPSMFVHTLRMRLATMVKLPTSCFALTAGTRMLMDDMTLEWHDITVDTEIQFRLRIRGGSVVPWGPPTLFDINHDTDKVSEDGYGSDDS